MEISTDDGFGGAALAEDTLVSSIVGEGEGEGALRLDMRSHVPFPFSHRDLAADLFFSRFSMVYLHSFLSRFCVNHCDASACASACACASARKNSVINGLTIRSYCRGSTWRRLLIQTGSLGILHSGERHVIISRRIYRPNSPSSKCCVSAMSASVKIGSAAKSAMKTTPLILFPRHKFYQKLTP